MLTQTAPKAEELNDAQRTAARWRSAAGDDSPAGPLYVAGEFAEADIIGGNRIHTDGPACTVLYACTPFTNNSSC